MIRLVRTGFAGVGALVMTFAGLVGWNVWTYQRLSAESLVADLDFSRVGEDSYQVTVQMPDGTRQKFPLTGDDWQLDARLVTWSPWMRLLGNDPMYRLDRLSGRYRDIERARRQPASVHALSDNPGLDIWALVRDGGGWVPGVDAAYGSAVFLPMADGARYRVSLGPQGLIARPYNEKAASAVSTWY